MCRTSSCSSGTSSRLGGDCQVPNRCVRYGSKAVKGPLPFPSYRHFSFEQKADTHKAAVGGRAQGCSQLSFSDFYPILWYIRLQLVHGDQDIIYRCSDVPSSFLLR